MASIRNSDSYSYGTCTYDGDADDDSFQTAACSMYSGFRFLHAIIDDETTDAEQLKKTEDKEVFSEDLLSLEIRSSSDDNDDNLSYISDIEGDDCRDRTFIFTAKKNMRLNIMNDSSQSLMSLDTANITLDTENIPDLDSIATGSTLLNRGIMSLSSLTLSHGPSSIPLDWFATMTLQTRGTREKKFRSIPIKSTFFDFQLYQKIDEEYESTEAEPRSKEPGTYLTLS